MTTTQQPTTLNGVNVEAILGARQHMTDDSSLAQFQWRARSEWVSGTHSRSTVEDFTGAGGEQAHRQSYSFDVDHPEIFASEDNGPAPIEYVLVGLAGCLTAGIASVAENRGVKLESVTATLEGNMDLQGILGIDRSVRNGYESVNVSFDVRGDASDEELRSIVEQSKARSAVYDIVSNPVPVSVEVSTNS